MKKIQFRPLHDNEFNLLFKMGEAGETGDWTPTHRWNMRVAYRYQEHRRGVEYTVAMVRLSDDSILIGCTKRNPGDPKNRIRGQIEALRRAFESDVMFEPASVVDTAEPEPKAAAAGA